MPAYDYSCQTCGARFEVIQSFAEDSLTVCPQADSGDSPAQCAKPGKGQVSKVFSVPSIAFKGEGFYRNDSGASKAPKAESSSASSSSASSEKTAGSSEKADKGSGIDSAGSSNSSDSSAGSAAKSGTAAKPAQDT